MYGVCLEYNKEVEGHHRNDFEFVGLYPTERDAITDLKNQIEDSPLYTLYSEYRDKRKGTYYLDFDMPGLDNSKMSTYSYSIRHISG